MHKVTFAFAAALVLMLAGCDRSDVTEIRERIGRVFDDGQNQLIGDGSYRGEEAIEQTGNPPLPSRQAKEELLQLFRYGAQLDFDMATPIGRAQYKALSAYLNAPYGSGAERRAWAKYARLELQSQDSTGRPPPRTSDIDAAAPKTTTDDGDARHEVCHSSTEPVSGTISLESEFSSPDTPYFVLTISRPYCLTNPWTGDTSNGRRVWLGFSDSESLPSDISDQLREAVGNTARVDGELSTTGNAVVTQCCEFVATVKAVHVR